MWTATLPSFAQDAASTDKPAATDAEAKTDGPAQLRAAMHRTLADLIEAQAAEKPDAARIKALTDQLQTLRGKIWTQRPTAPYAVPAGWRCPREGPGMGYGRARSGRGYGRGPGWGAGPGYGRTAGRAAGRGAGIGYGWAFIDKDRDGICDNYEAYWGER